MSGLHQESIMLSDKKNEKLPKLIWNFVLFFKFWHQKKLEIGGSSPLLKKGEIGRKNNQA